MDELERALVWMALQAFRPSEPWLGFNTREWWIWSPVRDAYHERWPR